MQCNCSSLRNAARVMTALYDDALRPAGLRSTQYSILSRLSTVATITLTELARLLIVDRTTLARNLGPLEREGLVRIAAGQDKRERVVSLAPAGKVALAAARPLWLAVQARFEGQFGAGDAQALRASMAQVVTTGLDLAERHTVAS